MKTGLCQKHEEEEFISNKNTTYYVINTINDYYLWQTAIEWSQSHLYFPATHYNYKCRYALHKMAAKETHEN